MPWFHNCHQQRFVATRSSRLSWSILDPHWIIGWWQEDIFNLVPCPLGRSLSPLISPTLHDSHLVSKVLPGGLTCWTIMEVNSSLLILEKNRKHCGTFRGKVSIRSVDTPAWSESLISSSNLHIAGRETADEQFYDSSNAFKDPLQKIKILIPQLQNLLSWSKDSYSILPLCKTSFTFATVKYCE